MISFLDRPNFVSDYLPLWAIFLGDCLPLTGFFLVLVSLGRIQYPKWRLRVSLGTAIMLIVTVFMGSQTLTTSGGSSDDNGSGEVICEENLAEVWRLPRSGDELDGTSHGCQWAAEKRLAVLVGAAGLLGWSMIGSVRANRRRRTAPVCSRCGEDLPGEDLLGEAGPDSATPVAE
jgi:hypothetical protein